MSDPEPDGNPGDGSQKERDTAESSGSSSESSSEKCRSQRRRRGSDLGIATSTPDHCFPNAAAYGPGSYWCGTGGGL